MFSLQIIYHHPDIGIDAVTIAVSNNRAKLQEIIDKVEQVQKPNNDMLGSNYCACADNWTEKVSEILNKATIPHNCHPEWDWDVDNINLVINQVVEV